MTKSGITDTSQAVPPDASVAGSDDAQAEARAPDKSKTAKRFKFGVKPKTDGQPSAPSQSDKSGPSRWSRARSAALPIALTLIAVVALVFGVLWLRDAQQLRSVPAASNDALVDASATSTVEAEVSQGLTQVLTYDYNNPDATQASAEQVLRGDARDQYAELFAALQERAAGDQLTLTATVRVTGVEELEGDRARLLVFLDQTSTRVSDQAANVAAAQVEVEAQRVDGTWRITGLEPL